MYINFKILLQKNITESQFILLQKIAQKELLLIKADNKTTQKNIKYLLEQGYIQYLKNSNEKDIKNIRISKKGKQLLLAIETPLYSDYIGKLLNELISIYESNGKYIGNKLEVQNRLVWFVANTGFNYKTIINAVEEYITENPEYTKSLENLIWSPPSKAFSVHKHLKDSKLFDIISNKFKLNDKFFIDNKNKLETFLFDISKIQLPKKMDKKYYFTGGYKTDQEHLLFLRKELLKRIK